MLWMLLETDHYDNLLTETMENYTREELRQKYTVLLTMYSTLNQELSDMKKAMPILEVIKLNPKCLYNSEMLSKAYTDDCGMKILVLEETIIPAGKLVILPTSLRLLWEKGYTGELKIRSSAAKRGLFLNGGVLDTGCTGEITVMIMNFTDSSVTLMAGDSVAQLIVRPVLDVEIKEVIEFSRKTKRGGNGFGSTGSCQYLINEEVGRLLVHDSQLPDLPIPTTAPLTDESPVLRKLLSTASSSNEVEEVEIVKYLPPNSLPVDPIMGTAKPPSPPAVQYPGACVSTTSAFRDLGNMRPRRPYNMPGSPPQRPSKPTLLGKNTEAAANKLHDLTGETWKFWEGSAKAKQAKCCLSARKALQFESTPALVSTIN